MDQLVRINHIQRGRLQGVLSVDIKGLHTVDELKNRVASLHGLTVEDILYRGVKVEGERQLKCFIPDLKKIGAPRFSVRTSVRDGGSEFDVYVMSEGRGIYFRLGLSATSTVADLKEAISAKNYVDYDRLTVFFKTQQLVIDATLLTDYGVVSGDKLYCFSLFGGGKEHRTRKVVDMGNTSTLTTAELVDVEHTSIPYWEHACHGLNIRGKCLNRHCEAYGSFVLCHKRFTVFNILEAGVDCPACKKSIEVVTCLFAGCQWMFEGRKKLADVILVDVMSGWTVTKRDECQWFGEDSEGEGFGSWNMAQWSSLIITARSLPDDTGDSNYCSMCFEKVELPHGYRAACGHDVHPKCVSEFEKAGYTTCPTCRNPLSHRAKIPSMVLAHSQG